MEAKIQRHIIKEYASIIKHYMKWMSCEHKWKELDVGNQSGYYCTECNVRTLDEKLSKLIKKLLATKK